MRNRWWIWLGRILFVCNMIFVSLGVYLVLTGTWRGLINIIFNGLAAWVLTLPSSVFRKE